MATMEGSLSKWTNVMKGWQYRWFVLDDNAGLLSYYTSREKMIRGVRRGCVRLKGAVIGIDDEDTSTFTITVDSKTFHFQARDGDEREKWIRCLEDTILRHAYGYKSPSSLRLDMMKASPTMQDFDKKLSEADAYLQLLIDQTKAVESKADLFTDPDDKHRCNVICTHANNMLEQMKHTIVLLQIAKDVVEVPPTMNLYQTTDPIHNQEPSTSKSPQDYPYFSFFCPDPIEAARTGLLQNTAHPVNGTYQPVGESEPAKALEGPSVAPYMPYSVDPSVELGSGPHPSIPLPTVVPETSYSSSEEEDFYDANEEATPGGSFGAEEISDEIESVSAGREATEEDTATTSETTKPPLNYYKPDGTLDYDVLYEPCEETNISMEGSVVTHLLSQVKIGMDLTKVALPTFILERRSLLEMYADYFAHPDLFVGIADQPTEKDRMVEVVRWYLCSYHAGRKSTVAKKPYNPILGEVFQCHWDLESIGEPDPDAELVTDGPVPWCNTDQLTFVAEQVSHHPPISAFYAEHYNKRISFNAHVWTKSKFLGLSVGVHNIGCGVIHVLDHDEQYVVTFPNGYGRSILTVPWIELGGSVAITCEKTGYRAQVEFITKPFYGGKKNRITGEVFAPNEKKPFLSIAGEWNGSMEAKWADGRTEMFADVNKLTIIKKNVRPIDLQEPNESRKLWKEVTAGLWLNNVTHASNAKCELEKKQRMEAQERKDQGKPWETKLFQPGGEDNWIYMTPLADRLKSTVHR